MPNTMEATTQELDLVVGDIEQNLPSASKGPISQMVPETCEASYCC